MRELVLGKRKKELAALLKQIKGVIETEEWDTVVLAVVKVIGPCVRCVCSLVSSFVVNEIV